MTPSISSRPRQAAILLGLLFGLGSQALADEHYRLEGSHQERGRIRVELSLVPHAETVDVSRRVFWSDGSTTTYLGTVPKANTVLKGELQTSAGIRGAMEGGSTSTIGWSFRRGEACASSTRDADGSTSEARGERLSASTTASGITEAPKAIVVEEPKAKKKASFGKKLKGKLLDLSKEEAAKALRKGVEVDTDLGRFAHLGVRAKLEAIAPEDLTSRQREALRAGPAVWVKTELEGGARLGTSTSIELGGAALGLGLRAGTELSYRVVERYPLTPGQSAMDRVGELASAAREAHSLPLSAADAADLGLGSARVFQGAWNVVFSGSLAVGDPTEARVSFGGNYQYRDHFQLQIERLEAQRVRVRLVRTKRHSVGASAKAVVGVAVTERLQELVPGASFVTKPVGREVEKFLRVELSLSAGGARERDFELCYDLDLAKSVQAQAYERAIRGDWRGIESTGATLVLRRIGFERTRHSRVKLGISKLASFERTSNTTRTSDRIKDAEGEREERSVKLVRGKKSSWFGKDEEHNLSAESLWTIRAKSRDLTIQLLYKSRDEFTRKSEFNRLRGALMAAGFAKAGELRHSARKTRAELELKLDDGDLKRLQRVSREQIMQAYAISVQAITQRTQLWIDPAKRTHVRLATKPAPGSSKRRTKKYPTQRGHLKSAERFADALATFATARSQSQAEDSFLRLAKTARWELYEIAALARLVGGPANAEVRALLGGAEFR